MAIPLATPDVAPHFHRAPELTQAQLNAFRMLIGKRETLMQRLAKFKFQRRALLGAGHTAFMGLISATLLTFMAVTATPALASLSVRPQPDSASARAPEAQAIQEMNRFFERLNRLRADQPPMVETVLLPPSMFEPTVPELQLEEELPDNPDQPMAPETAPRETPRSTLLRFLMPVRNARITSRFGWRHGRPHTGTDFGAPVGSPIYAVAAGKVVVSGWGEGYGKMILIDHGDGLKTRYGHCSQVLVRNGARVAEGQLIGRVGNTGRSTGPHLHFEVLAHDVPRNPERFLTLN